MVISPIVLWCKEKIYEVLGPLWNLKKPSSTQLYFPACKFQNTKSKLIDWTGNIFNIPFLWKQSKVKILYVAIKDNNHRLRYL